METTIVHVVELKNLPIFDQLQLEEALLRADDRNWCIINHGSPPAIVMGISSKPEELIHLERIQQQPITLIRRFSGGGTVVIDEETVFVTFIFSTSSVNISPFPQSIMRWTEPFYQSLFKGLPFSLRDNDYVLEDKKFGGNAQSITKNRWLHHTSLLWNYKAENMAYLKNPLKAPNYRQKRAHADFLCSLKERWPSPADLSLAILQQAENFFTVIKLDLKEASRATLLPHRKMTRFE